MTGWPDCGCGTQSGPHTCECGLFDALPPKRYRAILADPPWHFRCRTALQMSNWKSRRDAERHYPVMGTDDIAALPVRDLVAPEGCHLFLWATGPCLPQALEVMQEWGFRFSTVAFTWIKLKKRHRQHQIWPPPLSEHELHVGLGLTTRKNAEFVLLGRRDGPAGGLRRRAKDVREVIFEPVREHSRKPDEVYRRIERYCAGPYLDLFAREPRPGWSAWGNEKQKFKSASVGESCNVESRPRARHVGGPSADVP